MANRRAPRHVRVFLASPGDVLEERRATRETLQQLERAPLVRQDFTIEVVSWDDPDAPVPMLATLTPQQAVSRALPKPSECDLTVAIFAGRMGTALLDRKPDGSPYRSGTEWEFEDARRAGTHILLYRCLDPRPFPAGDEEEQARQRASVEEFFAQFRTASGTLTGGVTTYRTVDDLSRRLRTDVEVLLRELSDRRDDSEREELSPDSSWFRRGQSSVRRWHVGRLVMACVAGGMVTLTSWAAFMGFSTAAQEYDAPLLAYVIRYALLTVGVAVPAVLATLLWWWLTPRSAREPG